MAFSESNEIEAGAKQEMRQTAVQFMYAGGEADMLLEIISKLESSLVSVLRQEQEGLKPTTGTEEERKSLVGLASTIRDVGDKIRLGRSIIESIIKRLEI